MSPGTDLPDPTGTRRRPRALLAALAVVPLVGALELGLHLKQTTGDVVPPEDWRAARDAVKAELRPDDLVLFSPFWADPLGRRWFGDDILTVARAARPDETRFPRAFEVSIRGAHAAELAGWKKVSETRAGRVRIGLYENPAPAKVLADLVNLARPESLAVTRVDPSSGAETACPYVVTSSQGGSTVVPQGALVPPARFQCPGSGFVGVAVLHDLEHRPRRCIFAAPMGPGNLKLVFKDVAFGTALHGHSGIQWVSERTPAPERVGLAFSAFDRPIGQHAHKVGVGWVGYELPTDELAGRKGDLVAEVSGANNQRYYCFEADTR